MTFGVFGLGCSQLGTTSPVPIVDCAPPCPFDYATPAATDLNGFVLEPAWHQATVDPGVRPDPNRLCGRFPEGEPQGKPKCTSFETKFNGPTGIKKAICSLTGGKNFKGHVNWEPATFRGRLYWVEEAFDGDFNWDLEPNQRGILTKHRSRLHTEARRWETVDYFDTKWWSDFREANPSVQARMVSGQPGVVSGLLNLDNEHDAYSELHPIYAFAVRIDQEETDHGRIRDRWALFLRVSGDEGFCASGQLRLEGLPDDGMLTIKMPFLKGFVPRAATGFDECAESGVQGCKYGTELKHRGDVQDARLTWSDSEVTLRARFAKVGRPLLYGEIEFLWTPSGTEARVEDRSAWARTTSVAECVDDREPLEEALEAVWRAADPRLRAGVERERTLGSPGSGLPVRPKVSRADDEPPSSHPGPRARVTTMQDETPAAFERAEVAAFCDGARALARTSGGTKGTPIDLEALTRLTKECGAPSN